MKKSRSSFGRLFYILPPILVLAVLGWCYYSVGMYPFGDKNIAWCDLRQQSVPLYMGFKAIMNGEQGVFLNMNNAGGMNMWGVIFFFLASPFTFLTLFVDNENMYEFMNVLVALKLSVCSLTAAVYFKKSFLRLSNSLSLALSLMYAFCGYGFVFYQNPMWLDIMYTFPLLMLGYERLIRKRRPLLYIVCLAVCLVFNYYLGYMIVSFTIVLFGLLAIIKRKRFEKVSLLFIISSILAALCSSVVWLPSFIQYLGSGRTSGFIENMQSIKFITDLPTVLPLVILNSFVTAVLFVNIIKGEKKTPMIKVFFALYILMLIPIIIEPVNKMWHTGNYMAFSGRYAFITVFLGLILSALYFRKTVYQNDRLYSNKVSSGWTLVLLGLCVAFNFFSSLYYKADGGTLSSYAPGLTADIDSLYGIMTFCIIAVLIYALALVFYKKLKINSSVMAIIIIVMTVTEATFFFNIYMASALELTPAKDIAVQTDLSGKIEDDEFYRVKMQERYFDDDLVGGLGFNSLNHYTSLTDGDFMNTMKYMGYSSFWMKLQSNGSTPLCDSIFSLKYTVSKQENENTVYSNSTYCINKNEDFLPLGIICENNLSEYPRLEENASRAEIQNQIYTGVFGDENPITQEYEYQYADNCDIKSDGAITNVKLKNKNSLGFIKYNIHVDGEKMLYLDVFSKPSTEITVEDFEALTVYCNGSVVKDLYPIDEDNGFVNLGTFTDEDVEVSLIVNKNFECKNFGLFSFDDKMLKNQISQTQTLGLSYSGGKISGSFNLTEEKWCLVSIPYSDNYTVKINGRNAPYQRAFESLLAVRLPEGEGEISICASPKGFYLGVVLTVLGIALTVIFIKNANKLSELKSYEKLCKVSLNLTTAAFVLIIFMFYILPTVMSLIEKTKYVAPEELISDVLKKLFII